jgi:O-antigen chain-terminating methyltransferase
MKRTIEKLAYQRKEKHDTFTRKLEEIKKKSRDFPAEESLQQLKNLSSRIENIIQTEQKALIKKKGTGQIALILNEFQKITEQILDQSRELFSSYAGLIESSIALMDAKDKEWDALGSNHVGKIFKSLEWRVDKLAAAYQDVNLLMKKFLLLKEKLNQLLLSLEDKTPPSPEQIREVIQPLKDWRYAGFENRHRGNEEEVKQQQSRYLPYFEGGGKILDLGCGRGEFLDLLQERGIDAKGIEINEQMVEICRDKGIECEKGDILEILFQQEDNSLGGIFSSQVIEHLSPEYLKRMIEIAFFKLAPNKCIVLETLNPVSVFTLVHIYFLDLTHQKPIHPQTLRYLLESSGFEDVKIQYGSSLEKEQLQNLPKADETASILNRNIDSLNKLLYASPNYAAVGVKK